ncbi:HEPN domain-containing protein [Aliarcobacter cryaerophilus]|uniref:HEPN domain-containing protein n=1 Tax=Aliarcobacter cryaerophilus TaxID=28198 RepID=UPI0021B603F3|nr:HEPN domain-containing protein [Aliarcobacter cryaerophilus]MCT7461346.1 HEPN domain-containing protein [Aliarcobacter cryaerophilus]
MQAKIDLFNRLEYLDATINKQFLIDNGIGITEHNGIAQLLRKGVGIIAFNILEDFIKKRTAEFLSEISTSGIQFSNLPESLQEASIQTVLSSLIFKSKIFKKNGEDWKSLIQDESFKIYSTKTSSFTLSNYSLVSSNSNIVHTEVSDVIKAFGIKGGWTTMGKVASSIGSGIPDLAQVFNNASNRRHSAAHDPTFQYEHSWLMEIKNDILAISSSFDILLSARIRQIYSNYSIPVETHDINVALNYRFLKKENNTDRYREEKTLIPTRTVKIWDNLDNAINLLKTRLKSKNEFLIIHNHLGKIHDWYT